MKISDLYMETRASINRANDLYLKSFSESEDIAQFQAAVAYAGLKERELMHELRMIDEDMVNGVQDDNPFDLFAEERMRQIEAEGNSPEHDADHVFGELSLAAACYAINKMPNINDPDNYLVGILGLTTAVGWLPFPWPEADKRATTTRLRSIIKAGALLGAEYERIKMAEK